MRILAINWRDISNPLSGGAEIHLHEILKYIVNNGNTVTQISTLFAGAEKEEIIDGIKIIRGGGELYFNFAVPKLVIDEMRRNDYDIVIDDINKVPFYSPLYVNKPILAIIPHIFGKTIYNQVDPLSATYVYLSELPIKKVYKNAYFEVISKSTEDDVVKRGIPRNRIKTIECGIDHNLYKLPKNRKKPNEKTIIYVGRIKKYKSVDHIVKAMPYILEGMDIKLMIVGSGDYINTLKSIAQNLNIQDKVFFTGYVSQERKVELLQKAYLSVYPSLIEGWGLVNIEANACGLPVVASNVPGLKDSVKIGRSGLLYEYGNLKDLADKVIYLLKDRERYNGFVKGSIEWASTFWWKNTGKETLNYIESIIK